LNAPQNDHLLRLWRLCAADRALLARGAVLQSLQALTFIPFYAGVGWFVDLVLLNRELGAGQKLWGIAVYLVLNLLLWPIHALCTIGAFATTQRVVRAAVARFRLMIVEQLQRMSLSYFTARGAGALSNQVTVDMGRVETFLTTVSSSVLVNLVIGVATLLYLLALNVRLGALALLFVPIQVLLTRALGGRLKRLHGRAQQAGESFAAKMVEFIAGMRLTKSFGNEALQSAEVARAIEEMRFRGLDASIATRWLMMALQMVQQFMPTVLWCVGGYLLLGGSLSLGELIQLVSMLSFVQAGFNAFFGAYEAWLPAAPGVGALLELCDSPERELEGSAAIHAELCGQLELRDVAFNYPGTQRRALENLSLLVPAGQRVGLVGTSGAGKSTLLDLVVGFYAPTAGAILYDGHSLAELGQKKLRATIAIMGQDAFLFNTSVRENIRFGRPDASDAEVEAAARRAKAHDFIVRLERGYDTQSGERGAALSGGERQRIALARLFLRQPRVVVLDEPTSALDLETEAHLQADLDEFCAGRTTLVVAHRLSSLRNVDRILVIGEGRVLEDGAPAELLRRDGQFARLYRLQTEPARALASVSA
jgi:ATP-binding cassette, subfamily B, bacterial